MALVGDRGLELVALAAVWPSRAGADVRRWLRPADRPDRGDRSVGELSGAYST